MKVEESLDKVIITMPYELLMYDKLTIEFVSEVEELKEQYGELQFLEYAVNPRDYAITIVFLKEQEARKC